MKHARHRKDEYYIILPRELSEVVKFLEIESRMVVTRDGQRGRALLFKERRVSVFQGEKVLEMFHNSVNILTTTEPYT